MTRADGNARAPNPMRNAAASLASGARLAAIQEPAMHRPRSTLIPLVLALSSVLAAAATVTITRDRTPVMDGKNVLTHLPKGQRVTVTRTNGPWYLVQVTVQGKARSGWVHKQNASLDRPSPIHTPEPPGSEADAEKVFAQLKAKADKLAAEGKIAEAIDVMDTFPPRFGKTTWQKKLLEYTLELEKRQKPPKPEDLEKDAEDAYKPRRAEADKLAKEGKLKDAIEVLKGFPSKFADTTWAKEVQKRLLELQALERAPIADIERSILDLVRGGQFDEAHKQLDKAKDKGVPATHPQVTLAKAYIDLHKKAAATAPDKMSSNPFAVDPYAAVPQYQQQIRGLVHIVGPTNRRITLNYGKAAINMQIPTLDQQIDHGKRLLPNYPWSALLRLRLARVCVRAGKPDDALEYFSKAATTASSPATPHSNAPAPWPAPRATTTPSGHSAPTSPATRATFFSSRRSATPASPPARSARPSPPGPSR